MKKEVVNEIIRLEDNETPDQRYALWRTSLILPLCSHHDEKFSCDTVGWSFEYESGKRPWPDRDAEGNRILHPSKLMRCHAISSCTQCWRDWSMKRRGVPPLLSGSRFKNFSPYTAELQSHLAKCKRYAGDPVGFLLMSGPVGVGKTHLGVATMRESSLADHCEYISQVELIRRLRGTYDRTQRQKGDPILEDIDNLLCRIQNSTNRVEHSTLSHMIRILEAANLPLVERVQSHQLLLVDELGVSAGGNDVEAFLFELIAYRHSHYLPTIICTNYSIQELQERVGDRIIDRLLQATAAHLIFTGESYRPQARPLYFKAARDPAMRIMRPDEHLGAKIL